MQWKIWYSDKTTYTSLDGGPEEAPANNVQVIVQSSKDHGWQALSNSHFYIWRYGRWWTVDMQGFGLFQYLLEPGWKRVLFGSQILDDDYNHIWYLAMNDPDMPPKTGGSKTERRP